MHISVIPDSIRNPALLSVVAEFIRDPVCLYFVIPELIWIAASFFALLAPLREDILYVSILTRKLTADCNLFQC